MGGFLRRPLAMALTAASCEAPVPPDATPVDVDQVRPGLDVALHPRDLPVADPTTTTTEPDPLLVELSGVVQCSETADRQALGPFERRVWPVELPSVSWIWGGGTIVADLDGDGWNDAVHPVESGLLLYAGSAEGLLAPDPAPFAGFDASYASGGSAADYDGDGDLDLYVTRVSGDPAPEGGTLGSDRLLRNDGGFAFTDVTDAAGVATCCHRGMTSSWGDFDRDGDLDLYVGGYGWVDRVETPNVAAMPPGEPDRLYQNDGDGTFTDVSGLLPPDVHDTYAFGGGFHDLDGDGDLDLYVVADFGASFPNAALWNESGALVHRPGLPTGLEVEGTGMGLGVADFDGDGWLDLAVPEWNLTRLLLSNAGLGVWVDSAAATGFVPDLSRGQRIGWGTITGDVDNDGDVDIVSQFGNLDAEGAWAEWLAQPDGVWLATPDPDLGATFADEALSLGITDDGTNRGAMLADLDGDGFLDLVKRDLTGPDVAYVSRCGSEGWLLVRLRQPGMNVFAIGARITVEDAGERFTRDLAAGGVSFASSGPPELHVGLGARDRIERLSVRWPDGVESVVEDLETRQVVTIHRRF